MDNVTNVKNEYNVLELKKIHPKVKGKNVIMLGSLFHYTNRKHLYSMSPEWHMITHDGQFLVCHIHLLHVVTEKVRKCNRCHVICSSHWTWRNSEEVVNVSHNFLQKRKCTGKDSTATFSRTCIWSAANDNIWNYIWLVWCFFFDRAS